MFVTLNTVNSVEHRLLPNFIARMKQAFLTSLLHHVADSILPSMYHIFHSVLLDNLESFSQLDQQGIIILYLIDPTALCYSKHQSFLLPS